MSVISACLLAASLAACSGGSDDAGGKQSSPPKSSTPKADDFDCMAENVSQADWTKYCSDEGAETGGDGTEGTVDLEFGTTVSTVGAQSPADGSPGSEPLDVTPTTVVYQKTAMGYTAANGVYAIIAVKDEATSGGAAESAPIEGGGWQWIAPDGEALEAGEGGAASITPSGFAGGGMIPAGAFKWDTVAFDLTQEQADGGALVYTDGAGATFRWKVPAKDSGPELAKLERGMEGNY
ncbi:hypothetical protein ACIQNU_04535 [Streptomyces sp. NPDC091292]|uniref:hypothetical protein n=1 Tax=Streptomyces sp. NPDC091292 TaxID=3365991 RepID=UPI003830A43A